MQGTRLRILQHLQRSGQDTVAGISGSLGLSVATIRRHLDILRRDTYVTFDVVRKRTGRPGYSFRLTDLGHETMPKAYDRLLGMMIGEVSSLEPEDTRNKSGDDVLSLVFSRISDKVSEGRRNEVREDTFERKLEGLVSQLAVDGFQPEVESSEGKVSITLLNCPFRSVAVDHEAVCEYDAHLIRSFLGADPQRDDSIRDGNPHCIYMVEAPAPAPAGR